MLSKVNIVMQYLTGKKWTEFLLSQTNFVHIFVHISLLKMLKDEKEWTIQSVFLKKQQQQNTTTNKHLILSMFPY